MASGEAEPLQYTTTVLRVSIHCEGCKKKVKKVLHNIEGVYKVTVDAAQHKVTVTGNVGSDALIRRLHKAGKQAALWPAPAPAAEATEAKKPKEVAAAPPAAGEGCNKEVADKADAKPKEAPKDKQPEADNSEKKPEKDKGSEKKPEKAEAAKEKGEAKKDSEAAEPKEKGAPEPVKEATAKEAGGEEAGSGKKGKKKKHKQKDGGEVEAASEKPTPAPALGPERPHGAFPYYAPHPVMSYNVAHPSSSVSYYAPMPVVPMQPMPMPPPTPQMPYPPMMLPPPEFLYGPPGTRSFSPQESYNMFNEENANSCSLM